MNAFVQVYAPLHSFVLDTCPGVEWLDHRCMLNFLRKCQSFFIVVVPFYIPTDNVWEIWFLHILPALQLDVKSLISWNIVSYGDGLTLRKNFPPCHWLDEVRSLSYRTCPLFSIGDDGGGGFVFALPAPVNWKAAPKTKMDSDLTFFLAKIPSRGAFLV